MSQIETVAVGAETEDISVADWVAEFSQTPKPTAASPAAATAISARILEVSFRAEERHYSTLGCKKS
jgi:hypothetical protein